MVTAYTYLFACLWLVVKWLFIHLYSLHLPHNDLPMNFRF